MSRGRSSEWLSRPLRRAPQSWAYVFARLAPDGEGRIVATEFRVMSDRNPSTVGPAAWARIAAFERPTFAQAVAAAQEFVKQNYPWIQLS